MLHINTVNLTVKQNEQNVMRILAYFWGKKARFFSFFINNLAIPIAYRLFFSALEAAFVRNVQYLSLIGFDRIFAFFTFNIYCKNRLLIETFRLSVGDSNSFFGEILQFF